MKGKTFENKIDIDLNTYDNDELVLGYNMLIRIYASGENKIENETDAERKRELLKTADIAKECITNFINEMKRREIIDPNTNLPQFLCE